MRRPRFLSAGLLTVWFGAGLAGQAAELPAVGKAAAALMHDLRLAGGGVAVVDGSRLLHLGVHGRFTQDQVLPIASASKWLFVATILTLVEDGTLDLDAPLARYLPAFARADKRAITLRQCLSCTAGFAPRTRATEDRDATMAQLAAAIAGEPLAGVPGGVFRYGGVTFQVVACAAEAASGRTFHELFAARIAAPLGLQATRFGRLAPPGADAGLAPAPWVAGGAVSTLADYAHFLQLLAGKGRVGEVQVLRPATVAAMFACQSGDLQVRLPGLEFGNGVLHYGLGTWIQGGTLGLPLRVSDPGAFGFVPWLDLDLAAGGVLAVQDRIANVLPRLSALQDSVRVALQNGPAAGRDETVQLAHGGRDRSYLLHTPPQAANARERLPMVMVLHGGGGNGAQVAAVTGFSALADQRGFVVVYPNGTGPLRDRLLTWNSGGMQVYAAEQQVDDTGFLGAVVDHVLHKVAIDPERVYATGISNGAMMCHRLAREAPATFAAIAPVSGAMDFTAVDARSPMPVLIVHGTADQHVRYDGGRPARSVGGAGRRVDASVAAAADYYVHRNGLAAVTHTDEQDGVKVETWDRAAGGGPVPATVVVVTLAGGGHAWPGGNSSGQPDADPPFAWDATTAIWKFFAGQRRPLH